MRPTVDAGAKRRNPLKPGQLSSWVTRAHVATMMLDPGLPERKRYRLRRNFDTACWSYGPPHNMFIGTDIFEPSSIRADLTDEQKYRFVERLAFHELGHGLYTEKNLEYVNRILIQMGATFRLWNFFEDAYIEARFAKAHGYEFGWLEFQDLCSGSEPLQVFYALIQTAGDSAKVNATRAWPHGQEPDAQMLHDVNLFYRRCLAARSSMALMPVVRDWIERFGPPPEEGQDDSELATSHRLGTNPNFAASFMEDVIDEEGEEMDEEVSDQTTSASGGNAPVLSDSRTPINRKQVQRLVDKFAKLFRSVQRTQNTWVPQKRIRPSNLLRGAPPFRVKSLEAKRTRRFLLLVDCSGSMAGAMAGARLLVAALNELAKLGFVTGQVVFTGVDDDQRAIYEMHTMPFGDDVPERMQAEYGAEGIEHAIHANMDLALRADLVMVYTDAQISDKVIQKEELHKKGLRTWGLFVGSSPAAAQKLALYFDRVAMRETIEEMVDALLTQL